jgi:hypothetical protein
MHVLLGFIAPHVYLVDAQMVAFARMDSFLMDHVLVLVNFRGQRAAIAVTITTQHPAMFSAIDFPRALAVAIVHC